MPVLIGYATVLDLGIEDGLSGRQVREIYGGDVTLVGVDIWPLACKDAPDCYSAVVCQDAIEFLKTLENNSVDLIICAELIEHYEAEKAKELLREMFRVGEDVIVTTPWGFMRQDAIKGNVHQVHLSGHNLSDFEDFGVVYASREHRIICARRSV